MNNTHEKTVDIAVPNTFSIEKSNSEVLVLNSAEKCDNIEKNEEMSEINNPQTVIENSPLEVDRGNEDFISVNGEFELENSAFNSKVLTNSPTEKEEGVKGLEIPVFDIKEVVLGFEEAKAEVKNLYDKIFGYNTTFKPTYANTLGDLVAYLGYIAYKFNSEKEYLTAFELNSFELLDKFKNDNYIPYAIKIAVWAHKNRGCDNIFNILNGIIRSAFAFAFKENDEEKNSKVYKLLFSIIGYMDYNGVKI